MNTKKKKSKVTASRRQTETPRITAPPTKFHGGKYYLAPRIHEIAKTTAYVHRVILYAGGLGELWNWNATGVSEVVNDIDYELTNFWDVLRDSSRFVAFKRMAEATPFSEVQYERSVASLAKKGKVIDPVKRAFHFFVVARQSMAGRRDCFAPLSRNRLRRKINEQASAWWGSVDGLELVHARLAPVVVFNKDAIQVIDQQDGPKTLFYADPPYLLTTRTARDVYEHEMTRQQHVKLLRKLAHIEGKFILSGYDSRLYRKFERKYGWSRVEVSLPNNAAKGASKRRMIECLWFNWKIKEEAILFSQDGVQ